MSGSSVEDRVREWLATQGYTFELRVARALHKTAQFTVGQSEFYADPESGTQREIDVVADRVEHDEAEEVFGVVTLVIECKATGEPWILFTAERRLGKRGFMAQRVGNYAGRSCLHQIIEDVDVQALPLFTLPPRLGYGMRCMSQKKDIAFASAMAAAKAAAVIAGDDLRTSIRRVVFPIVAIDGLLFECYLPPRATDPVVSEIDRGVLAWKYPLGMSAHTIIDVVTSKALDDFLTGAGATAAELAARMKAADIADPIASHPPR